ncbi:hypothetical protein ABZ630_28025, partial [Streptomyces albidoflavus]|uniref:hypothetical protein n=1 Tax=Streptomyces albidoflavus TaxID=1886 RepID=UPI0033C29808
MNGRRPFLVAFLLTAAVWAGVAVPWALTDHAEVGGGADEVLLAFEAGGAGADQLLVVVEGER